MTDMQRMQEEAANNARAMYRRRSPSQHPTIRTEKTPPAEETEKTPDERPENLSSETTVQKKDLLDSLFEDKERALLILLLILLTEDGADSGVILALLYCAL